MEEAVNQRRLLPHYSKWMLLVDWQERAKLEQDCLRRQVEWAERWRLVVGLEEDWAEFPLSSLLLVWAWQQALLSEPLRLQSLPQPNQLLWRSFHQNLEPYPIE